MHPQIVASQIVTHYKAGIPTFFESPVSNTFSFPAAFLNVEQAMYGASYGASADGLDSPALWVSTNDGATWTKRSQLRQVGEPGLNETAITRVGPGSLLAISRSDDGLDTFGRRSDDMGATWGPLISYTSQVGVIQLPQLIRIGGALVLLGREALEIPGLSSATAFPRQLVAFVSYDNGESFGYGTVLDTYTGLYIDGGYCWPLRVSGDRVFVVYYADSHGLQKPDIKSLELRVVKPHGHETDAMHVVTTVNSAQATRALNLSLSRYSLDFRFRSRPAPAGSQFSVGLSGAGSTEKVDLVRWELPSTHASDPTADSGFISNGQFIPLLHSFAYDQSYRVRDVIDEVQGTQDSQILDLFGHVTNNAPAQAFAQDVNIHPTILTIGNHSTLRATDTLIDFVFVRPVADTEPVIMLSRIR